MADTLGSLCDKLTVVKLKQWHTDDPLRRESLALQETQLQAEVNRFLSDALAGTIPLDRLTFAANKVYSGEGNTVPAVSGSLGEMIGRLASVNCSLWHVQERVYDFERVPASQKDTVVKELALLNLERNHCIDAIDRVFRTAVETQLHQ
jgi:hypothetical protein